MNNGNFEYDSESESIEEIEEIVSDSNDEAEEFIEEINENDDDDEDEDEDEDDEESCENCFSTNSQLTICVRCERAICHICGAAPCDNDINFVVLTVARCSEFTTNSDEIDHVEALSHYGDCDSCRDLYRYCSDCLNEIYTEQLDHLKNETCYVCNQKVDNFEECTCSVINHDYDQCWVDCSRCTGCKRYLCLDCIYLNDEQANVSLLGHIFCQHCIHRVRLVKEELLAVYYSPDNRQLWTWQREIDN